MTTIRVGAKLASLVAKLSDAEKIITPRLTSWINQYGDDPVYQADIAEWIKHELTSPKPDRSGRFGPSSGGSCVRAQVYSYLGVPTAQRTDPGLLAIYANGTWSHLRMQATLLQAGIIDNAEVDTAQIKHTQLKLPLLRGTMDGVGTVPDDHPNVAWRGKKFGLEFKTANTWLFKHMSTLADPGEKYYDQVARYFLATHLDMIIILIEDKNTQELLEIVIERPHDTSTSMGQHYDGQYYEVLDASASVLNEQLPARLGPCQRGKGEEFRECPYGGSTVGVCHSLDDYRQAERARSQSRSNKIIRVRKTV